MENIFSNKKCLNCKYFPICGGECEYLKHVYSKNGQTWKDKMCLKSVFSNGYLQIKGLQELKKFGIKNNI